MLVLPLGPDQQGREGFLTYGQAAQDLHIPLPRLVAKTGEVTQAMPHLPVSSITFPYFGYIYIYGVTQSLTHIFNLWGRGPDEVCILHPKNPNFRISLSKAFPTLSVPKNHSCVFTSTNLLPTSTMVLVKSYIQKYSEIPQKQYKIPLTLLIIF